jgi:hypothetical protein
LRCLVPLALTCSVSLFCSFFFFFYIVFIPAARIVLRKVARWYIFKRKIQIWVNFRGSCNRRCWYILRPFGLFYGHLPYFVDIWYISWLFGIYFPILVCCSDKNLATLVLRITPCKEKNFEKKLWFKSDKKLIFFDKVSRAKKPPKNCEKINIKIHLKLYAVWLESFWKIDQYCPKLYETT